ncbi:MAG: type 1 glutamine amidotransferase [Gammaproteobacteria bacterium PRO9]|nr:type 1 glutamine amidotransferase [Gammaproteobacteria bacterium PRO9]
MPRLLVFQHVPHEILGTLDPLLKDAGFRIRYVNFGRDPGAVPDLDGYDGLIVLGGPMNCDEVTRYRHLATEVGAIRTAVGDGKPVLGICLGAQLLARALGAPVTRNPRKEIGWYDLMPTDEGRQDPLFRHFDEVEKVFQWHGDTFAIPPGAMHLAHSEACPLAQDPGQRLRARNAERRDRPGRYRGRHPTPHAPLAGPRQDPVQRLHRPAGQSAAAEDAAIALKGRPPRAGRARGPDQSSSQGSGQGLPDHLE